MYINYLSTSTTNKNIELIAIELDDLVATPSKYSAVSISISVNGGTVITEKIEKADLANTTGNFYMANGFIYVKPTILGLVAFADSIIKIDLKLHKTVGGYILTSNCAFIDVTLKCQVAALLQNIVIENENREINEKISTFIHLLHYGLINGSNCGCNCSELNQVFADLVVLLQDVDPQTMNDCGCK